MRLEIYIISMNILDDGYPILMQYDVTKIKNQCYLVRVKLK